MKIRVSEWNKLSGKEKHIKLVQARALNVHKWEKLLVNFNEVKKCFLCLKI